MCVNATYCCVLAFSRHSIVVFNFIFEGKVGQFFLTIPETSLFKLVFLVHAITEIFSFPDNFWQCTLFLCVSLELWNLSYSWAKTTISNVLQLRGNKRKNHRKNLCCLDSVNSRSQNLSSLMICLVHIPGMHPPPFPFTLSAFSSILKRNLSPTKLNVPAFQTGTLSASKLNSQPFFSSRFRCFCRLYYGIPVTLL